MAVSLIFIIDYKTVVISKNGTSDIFWKLNIFICTNELYYLANIPQNLMFENKDLYLIS
jgi:hypothetical protein